MRFILTPSHAFEKHSKHLLYKHLEIKTAKSVKKRDFSSHAFEK